ncbi:ATP-binding protein [Actinoplanes sp. NPDC024001]|uniref:ATP-binding protein n=1 Tax=Actinoplanes sp. NPDC024001 TaxID=3154598 RepID=UPI0033C49647
MPDETEPRLLTREVTLESLVDVRHEVERCAAREGLADLALYRFVVAVNELTTNAVRHGGGRGQLILWRSGDRLHCRVTDRGPGPPAHRQLRRPGADAHGGRGLWLAHHGVERLTVDDAGVTASARLI